jgi:hypothetical protein
MRVTSVALRLAVAVFAAFFPWPYPAHAVDLQQLVQETQKMSQQSSSLTMVWWIPQEFWDASLSTNPNVTPETRKQILEALENFQIVALFRGKTGIGGLTDVPAKEDMIAHARFESNGKVIEPLEPAQVSTGAQTMLAALKPLLSGMLGQLGQGMQLVAYPSKKDNDRLIDPKRKGSFQYTLFDQTFQWHLPLASLLPKKVDPKTKEEFPGTFDYNPYTGEKLSPKTGL